MNLIFDASALLNLANGGVLLHILSWPGVNGCIGSVVRGECETIKATVDGLLSSGHLILLEDDTLPGGLFLDLLDNYGLGPGETECLAFALVLGDRVCCDDHRARKMMQKEIGKHRLIGTLGLLVKAAAECFLEIEAAIQAYQTMQDCGGFLPDLSPADFRALVREHQRGGA